MGHYAAELGYQSPQEREKERLHQIFLAREALANNPLPALAVGDEVVIAIPGYYHLYDSLHKIFLEYCNHLMHAKMMRGIKVLAIKLGEDKKTYIRLGRLCLHDLWYDAQLFTKIE